MIKQNIKNFLKVIYGLKDLFKYDDYKYKKKIIYMLIPTHGNMGDQAIVYSTIKFYKENFPEYEVLQIDRDRTHYEYLSIKRCINKDDIIVLHGGGNMGNLYLEEEIPRRFIIGKFKKIKVISMTQTISFTNDKQGKIEREKTKKVYNKNKNLILLAREEESYKKMKGLFHCNILLVPDIVFYLADKLNNNEDRVSITTCLRTDKESILGGQREKFINDLEEKYKNIVKYDTYISGTVSYYNREKELTNMWNVFKKSKVVITDRLHGMIFCVITKTPCIVYKSLDHKVIESYKWIKDLDYIELVSELELKKINNLIEKMTKMKPVESLNFDKKYFNDLSDNLRALISSDIKENTNLKLINKISCL